MNNQRQVLFFDGLCNLCDGFVRFIVERNKANKFYIASIQSNTAKTYLSADEIAHLSTVIFVDRNGIKYYKSRAVFKVLAELGGIYAAFAWLRFLPAGMTNRIYDWVAKNRYKWFGKKDSCRIPTPKERSQFLD